MAFSVEKTILVAVDIYSIIVFIASVILMVTLLIVKPKLSVGKTTLSTFYWPPLVGAILLLCIGALPLSSWWEGLTANSGMNPLQILVLFFSMAFLSVVLDELGFFEKVAHILVKKAGKSQLALFFLLYFLCAILTMFTSNDIVIITFTPFILFFAKDAKINPLPFLFCEFIAANTWSMMFLFGNPTNVYLSASFGLDFISYLSKMWLPTILGGLVSLGILLLLFFRDLKKPIEAVVTDSKIEDMPSLIVSLVLLLLTIVLMAISSYIAMPMWLFSFLGAFILIAYLLLMSLLSKKKPTTLLKSLKRLPFDLAPFLLSMFTLIMALEYQGIGEILGKALASFDPIYGYGFIGLISCSFLNNIPMSVLFSLLLSYNLSLQGVFASIIASNIGAFLTPVGALAGILWMGILKRHGVTMTFGKFCLYGVIVALPTLLASLFGLSLLF